MNKIKIKILGSQYTINTNEKQEYVEELVSQINTQAHILMQSPRISAYDAMVLCVLDYADRFKKAEQNVESLKSQLSNYLEDSSRARIEIDERIREIDRLNREIAILKKVKSDKEDKENEGEN